MSHVSSDPTNRILRGQTGMPRRRSNPANRMLLCLALCTLTAVPSAGNEPQREIEPMPRQVDPQDFPKASFHEGLAAVRIGDRFGYINRDGQVVIPLRFQHAHVFSEGLARIEIDDRYGYIDRTGRIVIAPRFRKAHSFRDGLARVCTPPTPKRASLLFRIFELIGWDDREAYPCGYIDKTGKLVIDYQYVPAHGFENGYARVTAPDGREGYIDHAGTFTQARPAD